MYNIQPLGASTPSPLGENFRKSNIGQRSSTTNFSKYSALRNQQRQHVRKESSYNYNLSANEAREQLYQQQQDNDNMQPSSSRMNR